MFFFYDIFAGKMIGLKKNPDNNMKLNNLNPATRLICPLLLTVFISSALFSCKVNKKNDAGAQEEAKSEQHEFSLPDVPITITEPSERAGYLALHYWEKFAFDDTVNIHKPEVTEQAFSNFINILPHAGYDKAVEAIHTMLRLAGEERSGKMYRHFLALADRYLYDPNSPYRNEELYIPFVEHSLAGNRLSETEKIRPARRLDIMNRNRVGQKAADFAYILPTGKKGRLYNIRSEYILLYIYDPDCSTCAETTEALKHSEPVNRLVDNGTLTVLAFYPNGDAGLWREHFADMPTVWLNAFDKDTIVSRDELYDLKALPTLYLLDKNKHVLLKDVDLRVLNAWLYNR